MIPPNEKVVPIIEELVKRYGLREKLVSIKPVSIRIDDVDKVFKDAEYQKRITQEFTDGAKNIIESGSEVIVPMASVVALFLAKANVREINGVPIIDTVCSVVKMAEMIVNLSKITGVFISRRMQYAMPPENLLQAVVSHYGIKRNPNLISSSK